MIIAIAAIILTGVILQAVFGVKIRTGEIGETVETKWFNFTVHEAYVVDGEYSDGEETYTVPDGSRIVVAELTVKNTTNDTLTMYDDDFVLHLTDTEYTEPLDAREYGVYFDTPSVKMFVFAGIDQSYNLDPGESARGLLVFEIDAGDRNATLNYQEINENGKISAQYNIPIPVPAPAAKLPVYAYEIGERAETEWFDFTVDAVAVIDDTYTDGAQSYTVRAGKLIVIVDITIENTSGYALPMYADDFVIFTDGGIDYTEPLDAAQNGKYFDTAGGAMFTFPERDDYNDYFEVSVGASRTGRLVFEIDADARSAELNYLEVDDGKYIAEYVVPVL